MNEILTKNLNVRFGCTLLSNFLLLLLEALYLVRFLLAKANKIASNLLTKKKYLRFLFRECAKE